jgi:hypothetical protein
VTISGKDFDEVNQLACDARDAIITSGKAAIVFDADTTVGFIRSAMVGRYSSVWKTDTRFFKGQTVVPTEDDFFVHTKPFNCSDTIIPKFRFRAQNKGVSAFTEPMWPDEEGMEVLDKEIVWKAVPYFESNIIWELLEIWGMDNYVILAPRRFDPDKGRIGNPMIDVVLDLFTADLMEEFLAQGIALPVKEIFPSIRAMYYFDTDNDTVELAKTQITVKGCDWEVPS